MPRVLYSSKKLRRTAEAVSDFIDAAESFRDDRGNAELKRRVAEAAGRAKQASELANSYVLHQDPPAAGGRRVVYDPIEAWDSQTPFGDPLVEAIDHAHQVRGTLEIGAEEAEREERSLVGIVARFVGFPGRVRRHLEDRGYPSSAQTAGFVVAIAAQVVGTVVGGLILAWVVYLLGWS